MQTDSQIGIFTRAHPGNLLRACKAEDPGRRAMFRSTIRWSGARDLLERHGTCSVFVAPIGADNHVHYAGALVDLLLDPKDDASIADLLGRTGALDVAEDERLWDGRCKTLYVVELQRLRQPFPATDLIKLSDETPLSADYQYSYGLVRRPALSS